MDGILQSIAQDTPVLAVLAIVLVAVFKLQAQREKAMDAERAERFAAFTATNQKLTDINQQNSRDLLEFGQSLKQLLLLLDKNCQTQAHAHEQQQEAQAKTIALLGQQQEAQAKTIALLGQQQQAQAKTIELLEEMLHAATANKNKLADNAMAQERNVTQQNQYLAQLLTNLQNLLGVVSNCAPPPGVPAPAAAN